MKETKYIYVVKGVYSDGQSKNALAFDDLLEALDFKRYIESKDVWGYSCVIMDKIPVNLKEKTNGL